MVARNALLCLLQGSLEDAEDATNEEAFEAWYSYWRGMFPAVTTADIEEFEVCGCYADGSLCVTGALHTCLTCLVPPLLDSPC